MAEDSGDDPRAVFELGNRLASEQQWPAAAEAYRRADALLPNQHWTLSNLGYCLVQLGQLEEAIPLLRRAIALASDNSKAHANLVLALEKGGRRFEAIPSRRRLVELESTVAEHSFQLANTLGACGRAREAIDFYRRALELDGRLDTAASNYLLTLNYADEVSAEGVASEHFRIAQRWARPRRSGDDFRNSRSCQRKLRIGYLSADFGQHPVGKIMADLLPAHNHQLVEVYCYANSPADDDWTRRIQTTCDAFVRLVGLTNAEVESRILADQIDVLVDLGGHTGGGNRLDVFAGGAAPVQVAFLGYPNTSGLCTIDYRITDAYCDPPGLSDRCSSERLLRLDNGFLGFAVPPDVPPLGPPPYRTNGFVTFGSFNNPSKVSPACLVAWAEILKRLPGSQLVVKYSAAFHATELQRRWMESFAAAGVDARRLHFAAHAPSLKEHLASMLAVDLALDPFPYQGTTTTLECLTAGTPVLSLAGEFYARRVTSALMLRLGFTQLVTSSIEEYIGRAVELGRNVAGLSSLRPKLREAFRASSICNVPGFVAELETVLLGLWRSWCERNPPLVLATPLNGQQQRMQLIAQLHEFASFTGVVETGTFRGATAAWFAKELNTPVVTIESDARLFQKAAENLRAISNVWPLLGESTQRLTALAQTPPICLERPLFYLDAHCPQHYPIGEELAIVCQHWQRFVIIVDDAQVPHDADYGFNDLGEGRRLDFVSLQAHIPDDCEIWSPSAPASTETGARRGCLVISRGVDLHSASLLQRLCCGGA